MKRILLLLAIACSLTASAQQNVGINTTPATSAALDIGFPTGAPKGVLVPRVTTTERNAIATPAKGLMVYDSTLNNFYYHNGTAWSAVGGGPVTVLSVNKTLAFQLNVGSNITTNPQVIAFENVAVQPASATIGSWSTSGNTYTVGANGAGTYLVDVQLIAESVAVAAIPIVELNGAGSYTANNLFGTYVTPQNGGTSAVSPSTHAGRSTVSHIIQLAPGNTLTVRGTSSSTSIGAYIRGDASCFFRLVKLN